MCVWGAYVCMSQAKNPAYSEYIYYFYANISVSVWIWVIRFVNRDISCFIDNVQLPF